MLHKISWPKNHTYMYLCILYCNYLKRKYGNPTIVFDGSKNGPSIKMQRMADEAPKLENACYSSLTGKSMAKKDVFLANENSKQRFTDLLNHHNEKAGMKVLHAVADTDTLIVNTGVEFAKRRILV